MMPDDVIDLNETNPHAALWRSENYESPAEKRWLKWVAQVEKIVGHDLDGDQDKDGYSLDYANNAFAWGLTPQQYVADHYKKALFTCAQIDALRREYATLDGIDPCQPTYGKMVAMLKGMDQPKLMQLALANIKFLSKLARNRVKG
jgi:hypothetical protein